jgi:hypothetical protein
MPSKHVWYWTTAYEICEAAGVDILEIPREMEDIDEVNVSDADFHPNGGFTLAYLKKKQQQREFAVCVWATLQDERKQKQAEIDEFKELRQTNPQKWYMASSTMISSGNQTMIHGVFEAWMKQACKNSQVNAAIVIKALRTGFEEKLNQGGGWRIWSDLLYNQTNPKPAYVKVYIHFPRIGNDLTAV